MTVVATGTEDAAAPAARLRCNVDTALGVLRHADAGYEEAAMRREHGLGLGRRG